MQLRGYIESRYNEKGDIVESNLSAQKRRGIKKLKLRTKKKEVVIRPTDKSHKLCLCSWDNYVEQGKIHVEKDRRLKETVTRRK